ncbi:hypothetical protein PTI98_006845 [Pleurotus ostreatus]|nr:hypothetical protein PTI98_006845 [Pleurotus ostreatus]
MPPKNRKSAQPATQATQASQTSQPPQNTPETTTATTSEQATSKSTVGTTAAVAPINTSATFSATLDIFARMKGEFKTLESSLTDMHDLTSNHRLLDGQEVEKDLQMIRRQLEGVEASMKDGIEEIELLFDKLKDTKLRQALRDQIVAMHQDMIDKIVQEQVAACLAAEIPQEVQDEVARTKAELDIVQRELHNSQSQAANEFLREGGDEKINTIFMSNGEVSSKFPATLKELFALDGATVRQLLDEYDIPVITESRAGNLNQFIQFCGVQYQMIKLAKPSDRSSTTPEEDLLL